MTRFTMYVQRGTPVSIQADVTSVGCTLGVTKLNIVQNDQYSFSFLANNQQYDTVQNSLNETSPFNFVQDLTGAKVTTIVGG